MINLVTIGIARKDIQTIRQYSERLIQLRPNSQTALEGLATCAFADEDFEAAARYCEKLVEATPDHFERWFNLGVAFQLGASPSTSVHCPQSSGCLTPTRWICLPVLALNTRSSAPLKPISAN